MRPAVELVLGFDARELVRAEQQGSPEQTEDVEGRAGCHSCHIKLTAKALCPARVAATQFTRMSICGNT